MRPPWTRLALAWALLLAALSLPAGTADLPIDAAAPDIAPAAAPSVRTTTLRPRETLESALRRNGVSRRDAAGISAALRREVDLRRLAPGEQIAVERGADGALLGVVHQRSAIERYEVRPEPAAGDGEDSDAEAAWSAHPHRVAVETRVDGVAGRLEDSLFASMERLGERPTLTAKFVALFEWDFDFAADALPGDDFRMIVEKRFAGGALVGYGEILVAEYRSADRAALSAVRFPDPDGAPHYYDVQGQATRKTFLRAPLEFTRITSGYSHARRHPILGGTRPHLAVDYGAPTGTPVRAVADGVVTASGPQGGYGISVTVRHARGYETMYNHLSKALARRGDRVRQRDVIGRVGATGLATGPHLDYRVRRNGRSVDPLREAFFPGDPVTPARMGAFRRHVQAIRDQLALAPAESAAGAGAVDAAQQDGGRDSPESSALEESGEARR